MKPARAKGTWRGLALGLAIVLQAGIARAEVVERKPSEGDDDFLARVLGPDAELAQKVVRSTEISGGKVTLIGFVNADDDSLVGHVLLETSPNHYDHVTFPSCEEEGGRPELMAVFFARTAKDRGGRDLGVLCSWEAKGPITNGMAYSARFYRLAQRDGKPIVQPVTELEGKFETDDLAHKDSDHGKWIQGPKAKFSTVAGVKKLLTKMGIKQ